MINAIRARLAEFGIVAPVGRKGVTELLQIVADPSDKRVSEVARACLAALGNQLLSIKEQIVEFDRMIMAWHRSDETSKRLRYIPGVGPMLATEPDVQRWSFTKMSCGPQWTVAIWECNIGHSYFSPAGRCLA